MIDRVVAVVVVVVGGTSRVVVVVVFSLSNTFVLTSCRSLTLINLNPETTE